MRGVEGDEGAIGAIGPIRAEGADRTDVAAINIYFHMVRTPWE